MRKRRIALAALCAALVGLLLTAARSLADGPELDREAASTSPLLLLKPEAARMGAPDWAKPGCRITWFVQSASVPEGNFGLSEHSEGEWVDPNTGKRYRREEAAGSGGQGFAQLDVIAVGKSAVALSGAMYLIAEPTQPPTLHRFLTSGFVGAAAGPSDYWVHPKLLNEATQFHSPTFFVLKGNYALGDKQVPSLCVVTRSASFYSSQAYDLESGLLVASTVSSQGKLDPVRLPGQDAQRGNRSITTLRLVNVRKLEAPGFDGRNPDWAMKVQRMAYNGSVTIQVPGAPAMQGPAQMTVTFGKRGTNWAQFKTDLQFNIAGLPQQAPGEGVCGPAGGFWVDPAAFRQVRPNQLLDDDPVTHVQTRIGQVQGGRFTVVVAGPGVGTESMYDATTGQLLAFTVMVPASHTQFAFQLSGIE